MKHNIIKTGIIAATTIALLVQPGYLGLSTNHSVASAAAALSNKTIKLNADSSLYVRDAKLLMQNKGLVLSYTVTVVNNGLKSLDMTDYFVRVKGAGGKVYSASVIAADKDKIKVAPQSSINVTYFAVVGNQTKLTDISFEVLKWDFSQPNYERKLGAISISANTIQSVAAFQPSVFLFNSTKLKGALKQYYVTQEGDSLYVTISFLLENVGNSSANLSTLGFNIQTASYSVYDVNAASISTKSIQPNERKIVTMQAKLPAAVSGKSVTLIPFIKDEADSVNLPLGSFTVPSITPAAAAPANTAKNVYMDGQLIKTVANNTILNENDGNTDVNIDFTLNNLGSAALTLPDLEFTLVTKDNVSYPLNYTKTDVPKLLPNIEKSLSLTGTISSKIDANTSKLVVKTADKDAVEGYVIGSYKIKSSNPQGTASNTFTYDKDYKIKLDSIKRSAAQDSDVLIADVIITNSSNVSKSVLSGLNGYFLVNGVKVAAESKAVNLDQTINIAPNGSYEMIVYTNIPYTTSVDKITFVLTEKQSETVNKTLYQYSGQSISEIPIFKTNQAYNIANIGANAKVTVKRTDLFSTDTGNYFYAELDAVNLENRSAAIANLAGYLQDKSGVIAPIQISTVDQKLMPNGKVLLTAWGKVGKSFDASNYHFVFGQGVLQTTASAGDTTKPQTLVVKPVSFEVSQTVTGVKGNFDNIKFGAYTLSLKNVFSNLNLAGLYTVNGLKLSMDYDLTVDESYDYIASDHKLLVEFVDQDSAKATYSKQYSLIKGASGETVLDKGIDTSLEILFNDSDIQSKITSYGTYKLNVYDIFENAKILVASKELKWFSKD